MRMLAVTLRSAGREAFTDDPMALSGLSHRHGPVAISPDNAWRLAT